MTPSSVRELEFLRHVLEDVKRSGSVLGTTVESLYNSVERRARTRGFHQLLLVDFPDLGKVYDQGLSTGWFNSKTMPRAFGKAEFHGDLQNTWIYRELLFATFDSFGQLDVSTSAEDIAFTRQILYLYKKAVVACPEENVLDAVEEFVRIEEGLRPPFGTWDADQWFCPKVSFASDLPSLGLKRWESFWKVLDWVSLMIVPRTALLPSDILPKHGPGAVSDMRTGGDKYSFPHWPTKLEGLFPYSQFAFANEALYHFDGDKEVSSKEPPVRLLAVPKTFKGPRLIASEPIAHQFIQQGIMRWIRQNMPEVLRRTVNFRDQGPSREAALAASRSGKSATVDLSSASDRLSCWVVERFFRSNQTILRALHAARSRVLVDGTGSVPELSVQLRKFAAQGAAFTFPVQTLVYSAVAISSVIVEEGWALRKSSLIRAAGLVRVFGDDIILPSSCVPLLSAALTMLQLRVNKAKTHSEGYFRESCGMDAYSSTDVTPVYVRQLTPPTTMLDVPSWVEVSNSFHKSGYWATAAWMLSTLPVRARRGILTSHVDGGGVRAFTFCQGYAASCKRRWNLKLHRQEVHVLSSSAQLTRGEREGSRSLQNLLQYFLEVPDPETNWSSGWVVRNRSLIRFRWVPPA